MRTSISIFQAGIGAAALLGLSFTGGCAAASGDMGSALAAASGIPQMDAFLPSREAVPAGPAMAMDGDYRVSTINKRIRFEGGRAYAVDPWLHALSLKVRPGMVVIRDVTQTADNTYTGQDLPLMGKAAMSMTETGVINVQVAGALGPANYQLIPVAGTTPVTPPAASPDPGPAPSPAPSPADDGADPGLAGCETFDLDENGKLICLDQG